MKKKINKIVFPLVSLLIFLSLFFIVNKVLAVDSSYGLDSTISAGNLAVPFNVAAVGSQPGQFLSTKIGQMVGAILSFIGVILLILIIYAGILWMTSAGNEKKTEQAKSILISAIIGVIIVLSAYAITAFIGRQLTDTGAKSVGTSASQPPVDLCASITCPVSYTCDPIDGVCKSNYCTPNPCTDEPGTTCDPLDGSCN